MTSTEYANHVRRLQFSEQAAEALELAGVYAAAGLHPAHLKRLRHLARLLDVNVDDLMAAATDA